MDPRGQLSTERPLGIIITFLYDDSLDEREPGCTFIESSGVATWSMSELREASLRVSDWRLMAWKWPSDCRKWKRDHVMRVPNHITRGYQLVPIGDVSEGPSMCTENYVSAHLPGVVFDAQSDPMTLDRVSDITMEGEIYIGDQEANGYVWDRIWITCLWDLSTRELGLGGHGSMALSISNTLQGVNNSFSECIGLSPSEWCIAVMRWPGCPHIDYPELDLETPLREMSLFPLCVPLCDHREAPDTL